MSGRIYLRHHRKLGLERLEDRRLLSGDSAVERLNASPALFVENLGQWADNSIRFMHQGDGANVAMTDAGATFQVFRQKANPSALSAPDMTPTQTLKFSASFVGANRITPIGREPAETKFNYFVGDRSNWRTAAASYATVAYENLYSGIELQTWGRRESLKYEFHVAPGRDYRQVQVRYAGISGLSVAGNGSLHVNLGDGWNELIDDAPYVYQVIDGRQVAVAAQFQLIDSQTYAFDVTGAYDSQRELVIDPDLAWASYLGGSGGDYGYGISLDASDNAFVTGYTASANFSGKNNDYAGGNSDAFVAKVSSQGTLLWATYLGGSADDYSYGIAVDTAGNAYVTGNTNSPTFAGANNDYHGGAYDAYAAKISTAGVLQWTTFLGGGGYDYGYGIAVNAAGDAFVTGQTTSGNFAGANNAYKGGNYDAFAAKIAATGTLAWATYLGGTANDVGRAVAVDNAENVFVTGNTASTNFTGRNNTFKGGDMDGFALKISSGTLAWATYVGGDGNDFGYGIALDASNNVLLTGSTTSTNFSGANNAPKGGIDAFAAKVGTSGTTTWAAYLGGSKDDIGYGIAASSAGSVFVSGNTTSANLSGANNAHHGGTYDAFAAKLSATGIFVWATYLGGSYDDSARDIWVNSAGGVFVAGQTTSANFSGANNSAKGSIDAFAARLDDRPRAPDLASSSDTGASDSDDLTYVDNGAADKTLAFSVGDTVAGATVTVYADGIAIGSATAQGSTTTVVTNGVFDLTEGPHIITARQTEPGQAESAASDALTVTIDTTLTVSVDQATSQCDPTADSPIHFTVRFSEPVFDFAANDVTLSGNAATANAAVSGSGPTYDVTVSGMTSSGTLILTLLVAVAHDVAGNANTAATSTDNVVLYNVATRVWNGRGTDGNSSTAENWNGRLPPSNGESLVFPADAAHFEVIDDLPADTRFCSIVVAGGSYRFQNPLLNSSIVKVLSGATLNVDSLVCDTLSIGAQLPGTTKTWNGKGADNKWTTPANWVGDKAPSPGDALIFPVGAARPDSLADLPPEMTLASITAPAVKLEGNAVLTAESIVCDKLTIGSTTKLTASTSMVAIKSTTDASLSGGLDGSANAVEPIVCPSVVGENRSGDLVIPRLVSLPKREATARLPRQPATVLKKRVHAQPPRQSSLVRVLPVEYTSVARLDDSPNCSHGRSPIHDPETTLPVAAGTSRSTADPIASALLILEDPSGTDLRVGPGREKLIDVLANVLVKRRSNALRYHLPSLIAANER